MLTSSTSKQPVGEHDFYTFFAINFGWLPDQVDAQPLDFLEEVWARWAADVEYQEIQAKEMAVKRQQSQP